MDPITLFALANGAVNAVKAGCKLYKDIKSAAGDVKGVLKDLDEQFHKAHPPTKPATTEQRNQFIEEKNRIIELNKKDGETAGIYQELGEHLGTYFDNMNKCIAVIEEEEKRSKTEIYTGDASLGKRALQRVLMKKQLDQMTTELREIMIYQSPPELGALWTEVSEMMIKLGEEQKILITRQMKAEAKRAKDRAEMLDKYFLEGVGVIATIIVAACFIAMMATLVQDRIEKYPQLGTGWVPKTERQRRDEDAPKVYIGR